MGLWECILSIIYYYYYWSWSMLERCYTFLKKKSQCVQKRSVCSDKLSCMGRKATFCSTLFLLLSSRFHFLSFLDIFWVGTVTSAKLVEGDWTNTIPALINMSLSRHICNYNKIFTKMSPPLILWQSCCDRIWKHVVKSFYFSSEREPH